MKYQRIKQKIKHCQFVYKIPENQAKNYQHVQRRCHWSSPQRGQNLLAPLPPGGASAGGRGLGVVRGAPPLHIAALCRRP